jgi:hypothetical protein
LVYGRAGRHSVVAPDIERRKFRDDRQASGAGPGGSELRNGPGAAQGHVTSKSVHGLYDVMKRANALTSGMTLELDITRARIDPDALEEIRACSKSHHLPARVDPFQSD